MESCARTVTISLPEPLTEAAARLARQMGVSFDQLCAEAIEKYVQARGEEPRYEGVTDALDRVYAHEPSELDPSLARLQAEALEDDKW